jgi:hypothetical protein
MLRFIYNTLLVRRHQKKLRTNIFRAPKSSIFSGRQNVKLPDELICAQECLPYGEKIIPIAAAPMDVPIKSLRLIARNEISGESGLSKTTPKT